MGRGYELAHNELVAYMGHVGPTPRNYHLAPKVALGGPSVDVEEWPVDLAVGLIMRAV